MFVKICHGDTYQCPFFILNQNYKKEACLGENAAPLFCNFIPSFLSVHLKQIQECFHRVLHIINSIYGLVVLWHKARQKINNSLKQQTIYNAINCFIKKINNVDKKKEEKNLTKVGHRSHDTKEKQIFLVCVSSTH